MRVDSAADRASRCSVADEVVRIHAALAGSLVAGSAIWSRREHGVSAHVVGLPYASCNSVYIHDRDADAADDLLSEVESHGLPFTVRVRSGLVPAFADRLTRRGLVWHEDLPLMAVEPGWFVPASCPADLAIGTLAAGEERIHMDLVSRGLDAPLAALEPVMSAANQAGPGWTTYVGQAEGALAVTCSAIESAGHVGLIAIATEDRFRRRGYGAAVASRAVSDAFHAGAARAFLHSSPMGFRLYEALGFRTLERLTVWVRAG
jgi:ribosomal protein S18 acetylase RimI-like enzyme